eukprot:GHVR01040790.1.p2 GENE.GHVR01040790.1~~GHVR01040790.1.p2  ORF type:complete len:129 (-),score=17.68 GHVR01040790.1:544-930(-)
MYTETEGQDVIIRDSDGAAIPMTGGNRHYTEYLEWVAAGNIPKPFIKKLQQAEECTAVQGRLALKAAGKLDAVQSLIDKLPASDDLKVYWEYATVWHRSSPNIQNMGAALGLASRDIDDLFNAAAAIE